MISDILNEFRQRGALSVSDLCNRFQVEVPVMEGMLQTLERKGRIAKVQTKCGTCKGCVDMKPEDVSIFQLLEKKTVFS
jgi:putative ferrous iron transport protein C